MKTQRLLFSSVKHFLDWVFSAYHHTTQVNHYVDFVAGGIEVGFIPAEALSECPVLYPEVKPYED